jgi:hypothetical protein
MGGLYDDSNPISGYANAPEVGKSAGIFGKIGGAVKSVGGAIGGAGAALAGMSAGTSLLVSTGLSLIGGIMGAMSAKTPKIQRSAQDSILMTLAKQYQQIGKRNKMAANMAAGITGMPASKFSSSTAFKKPANLLPMLQGTIYDEKEGGV